jgi:hypothetical protein
MPPANESYGVEWSPNKDIFTGEGEFMKESEAKKVYIHIWICKYKYINIYTHIWIKKYVYQSLNLNTCMNRYSQERGKS